MSVFTTFTNHLDGAVKNLQKTCADQTGKFQSHFKREYQMVGKAFMQLGQALQQDGLNSENEFAREFACKAKPCQRYFFSRRGQKIRQVSGDHISNVSFCRRVFGEASAIASRQV